ncbi:MAG: prepilin-type N-terminal cleavage/methylation domain-containing protein [Phycisphaerales bacterium]
MKRHQSRNRSGFTIIETVLAIVIGGLVLLGCVSVFLVTARAEKAYSQRYERTNELWTTQLATRRTFLNLLMEEQSTTGTPANGTDPAVNPVRPRLILEPDMAAPANELGARPQRLEVTVGRSPVPSILGSQIGAWLVEQDRASSLDFASTEVSSGAIRGVYELRPSGTRETIMMNLGIMDADPKLLKQMESDPPPGWTLWWRPILSTELLALEAGITTPSDVSGSNDEITDRLAGAIPLLRGVDAIRWQIFKSDERVDAYAGTGITDLPAFAEMEIVLINGQYASWMFEIGWVTGEDPTEDDADGTTDEEEQIVNGGGGNNNGGNGGGGIRDQTTRGDLGGGNRSGNQSNGGRNP